MIAALLDHLWQSTLFAGVMGLLAMATRGNGARIRFALWFAASLKFLIPFSLLVALGSDVVLPHTGPITASTDAYVAQNMVQPVAVMIPALALPAIGGWNLLPIFLVIWALGFFTLLLVWFLRWSRLRVTLRAATPLNLSLPMTVKAAPGLLEPGLVGIWRPVLLLPEGIAARLTQSEMDAILAHEICHFRRRDNLTAAIHMIVEALFWFYPLVWWLEARMVEERERACDESVVESGNSPDTYAEAILKVCRFYARSPLVCASGVSGADLRKRIQTIMAGAFAARMGPAKKTLLAASIATVLAAPLLMGLTAPPMAEVDLLPLPKSVTSSPLYIAQMQPRQAIAIDPKSFDKYIGYYLAGYLGEDRAGPRAVFEVTRNGPHFFARPTFQHPVEFYPDSPNEFFAKLAHAQISFESDAQGKTIALDLHQAGSIYRAPRMDDAEGRRLQAELEQGRRDRIKNNKPSPGTEDSLRRYILSLESGRPNYKEMSPDMVTNLRQQYPTVQARLKNWGTFKSIRFSHVGPNGADFYDVRFANGHVQWWLMPLGSDGVPQGRPAVTRLPFHFDGGLF